MIGRIRLMRLAHSLRHFTSPFLLLLLLLFFFRPRQEREFAVGEPVPLSALRRHPRYGDPFNPPALVRLKPDDARRRAHPPFKPFIPRSVTWDESLPRTSLAFPRTLLNHLSRLRVVLDGSIPRAMYCPTPGVEFLEEHLASRYDVVPMHALALRDRERVLTLPSVFRFVLATHPFVRLESVYREGAQHDINSPEYRRFMASVRGVELKDGEREVEKISLRFFVAFLARGELKEPFDSVTRMCRLCELGYHHVGDVADLRLINERLGLSGRTIALPSGDGIARDVRLRGKVARLYADDMQKFQYDPTHA